MHRRETTEVTVTREHTALYCDGPDCTVVHHFDVDERYYELPASWYSLGNKTVNHDFCSLDCAARWAASQRVATQTAE